VWREGKYYIFSNLILIILNKNAFQSMLYGRILSFSLYVRAIICSPCSENLPILLDGKCLIFVCLFGFRRPDQSLE